MSKNIFLLVFIICFSCGEDVVPKPKGYLRLEYPKANYVDSNLEELPFSFETNVLASKISLKEIKSNTESYGINLEYPTLKGTVFLTYKAINGNRKNLSMFLRDAEKLTEKHMIKADEIPVFPYANNERAVYGKYFEVKGNVASQAQFYVTDSIDHFLTGSLYFYAQPNYDSILPAATYLQKDVKRIMESLNWKK